MVVRAVVRMVVRVDVMGEVTVAVRAVVVRVVGRADAMGTVMEAVRVMVVRVEAGRQRDETYPCLYQWTVPSPSALTSPPVLAACTAPEPPQKKRHTPSAAPHRG
jgi:hypothetical protein